MKEETKEDLITLVYVIVVIGTSISFLYYAI